MAGARGLVFVQLERLVLARPTRPQHLAKRSSDGGAGDDSCWANSEVAATSDQRDPDEPFPQKRSRGAQAADSAFGRIQTPACPLVGSVRWRRPDDESWMKASVAVTQAWDAAVETHVIPWRLDDRSQRPTFQLRLLRGVARRRRGPSRHSRDALPLRVRKHRSCSRDSHHGPCPSTGSEAGREDDARTARARTTKADRCGIGTVAGVGLVPRRMRRRLPARPEGRGSALVLCQRPDGC